jgi:branched-chain amino acid transport system substrate-binding protein
MGTYQGFRLWADAVKKGGQYRPDQGHRGTRNRHQHRCAFGKVTDRPATHHCVLDVHIAEVADKKLKVLEDFAQQKPADTAAVCNLIKKPNDNQQYVIKI